MAAFESFLKLDQKLVWPIVYSPQYNISFLGLEKIHPFDAGKWGRIFEFLKEDGMIQNNNEIYSPPEATQTDLLRVHTERYLNRLRWSVSVAAITEVPFVACLPNFVVQRQVLRPFRYQTAGTVLAARLALDYKWGINIGGGFHHCSSDKGGGFCAYADITLAIKFLKSENLIQKAMIVDLDAHQPTLLVIDLPGVKELESPGDSKGNGHEHDFINDPSVYIFDMFNPYIYPDDYPALKGITKSVQVNLGTKDEKYLLLLNSNLPKAFEEFKPDLVVYNAGTDILDGDPLGLLAISEQGIIERDEIVFDFVKKQKNCPIVMVTSGGYLKATARIIAKSILNLYSKGLIDKHVHDDDSDHGKHCD